LGYVFHIFAAFLTLASPELGWHRSGERAWAVLALLLAPHALAWLARRAFLAGRFRVGAMLDRVLGLAPVALQLLAVCELGWLERLERWGMTAPAHAEWVGLGLLPALLPFFLYQCAAIDARARYLGGSGQDRRSARAFQLRLLLSASLPFVVYLAGTSLIGRSPVWRVRLEEVGLLGALSAAALLGLFLLIMPFLLRHTWDTVPIERGWVRTTLEDAQKRAGFRCRELLLWRTGGQMANAAIVGFSARTRLVFFSDLLLAQLGPRELAAVFAHEMGHARRAHALVFGAFGVGFFLAADLLLTWSGVHEPLPAGAIVLGFVVLWYLAFGYLSRRFELEADLESLRTVGESGSLVRALELVTGAHAHERSSWRHFSTRDRVSFLQRAERDPLAGLKLRFQLARWRRVGFTLFLVGALLQLGLAARSWNEDWLLADLRLGRFEEAAERAQAPGVGADVAGLALLAREVPGTGRDGKALEERALEAFARGERGRAQGFLELSVLRGCRELEPVLDALEPDSGTALSDLPSPWAQALSGAPRGDGM